MANSNILKFYIIVLLIFSTISGLYFSTENNKNVLDYAVFSNIINNMDKSLLNSILKVVLLPFIVFDFLFILIGLLTFSFINLPPIITIIFISPLVIFVFIDYIIPMIRGN